MFFSSYPEDRLPRVGEHVTTSEYGGKREPLVVERRVKQASGQVVLFAGGQWRRVEVCRFYPRVGDVVTIALKAYIERQEQELARLATLESPQARAKHARLWKCFSSAIGPGGWVYGDLTLQAYGDNGAVVEKVGRRYEVFPNEVIVVARER